MGAGYGWQYEILKCPFCDKGEISCKWYPSATTVKQTGRTALGGKGKLQKSKEVWIIETGCKVCGKTAEEVEKEFRNKGMI
jgi:hypothetical protein